MRKLRIIQFDIGRSLLDWCDARGASLVWNLFAKHQMIVIRAEYLYSMDAISYQAISKDFDEVECGMSPPVWYVQSIYKENPDRSCQVESLQLVNEKNALIYKKAE